MNSFKTRKSVFINKEFEEITFQFEFIIMFSEKNKKIGNVRVNIYFQVRDKNKKISMDLWITGYKGTKLGGKE